MTNNNNDHNPITTILSFHSDDPEQKEFILSTDKKIIVQAPAGYGKTKTMVSKLAYIIASNQLLSPKKILALTFSVNAAYKIKKDVVEQLPLALGEEQKRVAVSLSSKVLVSNYHGFCRRVLSRYGYLLHENLKKINEFTSFDDSREQNITQLLLSTPREVIISCIEYSNKIKTSSREYLLENFDEYNNNALNNFIPHEYISFNSILTLTLKLFHDYPKVLSFYRKLFPYIIVDEFQDTNFFGHALLSKLVIDDSYLYLMGDSLQRIYGFIGAIPNILEICKNRYNMQVIELKNNYRFRDNPNMLLLESNIRKNAENISSPQIQRDALINFNSLVNQNEEADYVLSKCNEIINNNNEDKVAILFRLGHTNKNTQCIINKFDDNNINYFYGLFSDEDDYYKNYHFICARELSKLLRNSKLSRRTCKKHLSIIKEYFKDNITPLFDALIQLTEIFYNRLFAEYSFAILSDEDKLILIKETFDGFGLKQYMEYVNCRVIISTIHGAKGLEWDQIIMPDMEQYSIPSWFGYCGVCSFKSNCDLNFESTNSKYLEALSIFYVGFTRAKKEVFFSASQEGIKSDGSNQQRNMSCFLKLKGIKY